MTTVVKMPGALHEQVVKDLARRHPFAVERVGFVLGRAGSFAGGSNLILLTKYLPVPDDQYVRDPTVGARIGPEAMTSAMQAVYHGRHKREGIFHIHQHPHSGETGMSRTDARELPRLIPGFQSVGPRATHGIIILSHDHGSAWIWLPSSESPMIADALCIIGRPIEIFERGTTR